MSVANKVRAGFLLPLLLLIVGGAVAYRNAQQVRERNRLVTQATDLRKALGDWARSVHRVEYAQRGYLLTGQPENLDRMRVAKKDVASAGGRIRELAKGSARQLRTFDELEAIYEKRLAFSDRSHAVRDREGAAAAARLVAGGEGVRLTEQIGEKVGEMEGVENQKLLELNADAEAWAEAAMRASWFGTLLALVFCTAGSAVIVGNIVSPLRRLTAAARRIGGGDLSSRVEEGRQDEFGTLTREFNGMAGRLEQSQAELQHRGAILHSVLSNISDGVAVVDLEGTLLFFNPAAARILGDVTAGSVYREWRARWGMYHPDRVTPFPLEDSPLMRAMRGEASDEVPMFFQGGTKAGGVQLRVSARPLRGEDGEVGGGVAVFRDVTQRLAMEEAIADERNLLRTLIDSLPEPVYVKDSGGRYLVVNAAMRAALGVGEDARVEGKNSLNFIPAEMAERYLRYDDVVLNEGQAVIEAEEEVADASGATGWGTTTKVPLRRAGDGRVIGLVGIFRDITERKRAEERITKLNRDLSVRAANLEAANKELEAFSYSVSHDLRAPLRHIDGFAGLLMKRAGEKLDAQSRRYVETISRSAKEMGVLIDDLLVFSRMGRSEMMSARVALGPILRECLAEVERETQGRTIRWKVGAMPEVVGDPTMLRQVFTNLLSNAVKYTRTRAEAEIEAGSQVTEEGQAVVYVRDNGVGFDMQYSGKLFGVFQRLHSTGEFEGTGIGLANVRRIIERHGGRTWAEGAVGQGATFYFSIPTPEKEA